MYSAKFWWVDRSWAQMSEVRSYVWYPDGNKQVISLSLVAGIQNVESNSCFFMDSDEIKNIWVMMMMMMCVCAYVSILYCGRPERQEDK